MSQLVLVSDTLITTPAAGNLEYNGQFFGTDSNASRAQMQRITQGTAVASTSGTSIDFTSLPSWVKRITVMLSNVSSSGTSNWQIQIGDSGGVETTSYSSVVSRIGSTGGTNSTSTAGFLIHNSITAAGTFLGVVQIALIDSATNTWSCFGTSNSVDVANSGCLFNGSKATSATLDRVRITTANGTDTFDAGSINIMYEG